MARSQADAGPIAQGRAQDSYPCRIQPGVPFHSALPCSLYNCSRRLKHACLQHLLPVANETELLRPRTSSMYCTQLDPSSPGGAPPTEPSGSTPLLRRCGSSKHLGREPFWPVRTAVSQLNSASPLAQAVAQGERVKLSMRLTRKGARRFSGGGSSPTGWSDMPYR